MHMQISSIPAWFLDLRILTVAGRRQATWLPSCFSPYSLIIIITSYLLYPCWTLSLEEEEWRSSTSSSLTSVDSRTSSWPTCHVTIIWVVYVSTWGWSGGERWRNTVKNGGQMFLPGLWLRRIISERGYSNLSMLAPLKRLTTSVHSSLHLYVIDADFHVLSAVWIFTCYFELLLADMSTIVKWWCTRSFRLPQAAHSSEYIVVAGLTGRWLNGIR